MVYITARGHSGSTLLEMMLGAHPALASLGELKALAAKKSNACRCGAPSVLDCPFWKEVDARMQARSGLALATLDTEARDDADFEASNRAVLEAAAEATGGATLVDSSKSLRRLKRLDKIGVPIDVVLLTRGALGVVNANKRRGRDWRMESRRYTIATMKTRQYLEGRRVMRVDYAELARDPEGTLRATMQALGLELVPEQLDWAKQVSHTFAGNAMRFNESSEIRPDRRWRSELRWSQMIGILWLTLPTRTGPWLYEAHLPYWKGEGWEAWRSYRKQRAQDRRRRRRHRLIERFPAMRPWHHRIRRIWRSFTGSA